MPKQYRIVALLLMIASAAYAQNEFSWRMGPVDLNPGHTAKLIFANPFCPNPETKLDITLAITDLTGHIVQMRSGSQSVPAKKRAIVSCDESIQLEVAGEQISPRGTIVGILEVISDIGGVPWVPVNVPLASLQVGPGAGPGFHPAIVIIPIEPIRRLILP